MIRRLSAALAGCCLLVALLYASIASVAFSPGFYARAQARAEAPVQSERLNLQVIDFLRGEAPLDPSDFDETDRLHMDDVLHLFRMGRRVAFVCLAAGMALLLFARFDGAGMLLGLGCFAALLAGMGLWAALNFDGWFTAMHRLMFTNELWLLDPAFSTLINMMPLGFFIDAAFATVGRFLLFAVGYAAIALILWRLRKKHALRG